MSWRIILGACLNRRKRWDSGSIIRRMSWFFSVSIQTFNYYLSIIAYRQIKGGDYLVGTKWFVCSGRYVYSVRILDFYNISDPWKKVYELSLYLAVIFESQKQTASIIPTLFTRSDTSDSTTATSLPTPSTHSILISLLHHLVTSYPSQSTYNQHRTQISLRNRSKASDWLISLTRSLRMRNYAKFENLSGKKSVLEVIGESTTSTTNSDLGTRALLFAVDSLRRKAGDSAWDTIRSAYRELSCDTTSLGTKTWLRRSLCLDSVVLDDSSCEIESWLEQKLPLGHVRRKEGVEGRWIICKVKWKLYVYFIKHFQFCCCRIWQTITMP